MLASVILEVNNKLKEHFPENNIYVSDVVEGIQTPCFIVYIGDVKTERETAFCVRKDISIEIYYMPDDNLSSKQLAITNTRNALQDVFVDTYIKLENGVVLTFFDLNDQDQDDGVLAVELHFNCYLEIIEEDGVKIEDLELKGV